MSAVPETVPDDSSDNWEPPPGMRRSMEAYWRDLPALLKSRHRGKWVAYHGDERIGFDRDDARLLQECYRRGLTEEEIWVDKVEPLHKPPWEVEDMDDWGELSDDGAADGSERLT